MENQGRFLLFQIVEKSNNIIFDYMYGEITYERTRHHQSVVSMQSQYNMLCLLLFEVSNENEFDTQINFRLNWLIINEHITNRHVEKIFRFQRERLDCSVVD